MEPHSLDDLQQWFQAATTHPAGLPAAAEVESIITRSQRQSATDRLAVYARSYWARLLECLREEYPLVRRVVGEDAFDRLAVSYLQRHPPASYTLAELGAQFPRHLAADRPDDDFAAAVVELAVLERNISEVFDLTGGETLGFLNPEELTAVAPERRTDIRLEPLPTFRLLTFDFEVNDWYARLRNSADEVIRPQRGTTYVALSRREFIVRRHALSAVQAELLGALAHGSTLGEALTVVAERHPTAIDLLITSLEAWFAAWAAAGFFRSVGP